jgi:hypothetical protein
MKKNNILLLLSFAIFANSCEQLALTGSNVDKEKFTQLNPVDNSENAENVIDDDFFTN